MATPIIRKRKTLGNISNSMEAKQLINAGRKSASNAIRASKALGLEITYMKDRVIYKEKPNGKKTILIKLAETPQASKHHLQLKKGMIFNVNK
ncbi:MAG: hypothetical protein WCJ80_10210 [Bacteroidota bacterium]|jgi:hypothetical protein